MSIAPSRNGSPGAGAVAVVRAALSGVTILFLPPVVVPASKIAERSWAGTVGNTTDW
jgi:hypothetical protein